MVSVNVLPENLSGHCFHRSTSFLFLPSCKVITFLPEEKGHSSEIFNACMSNQKKVIYGKSQSPDPPFISHYAIIQDEMGLFLTFSVFELQRGYLYQNGVEFRQKVIGGGLNLFWSSSLLLRGYTDLSLTVGHMSECPHSGMRY